MYKIFIILLFAYGLCGFNDNKNFVKRSEIDKTSDESSKMGGRIGIGIGIENRPNSNLFNGHLIYFGCLYYPSYSIHTRNSTIGGSIGIMLQF